MLALISQFLVSGKALAAGVFSRPAASALPLTKTGDANANINLRPNKR